MLKILRTTLRQPCGLAKRKMVLRLPQEIPQKCVRRQVHGCRRADVKRALMWLTSAVLNSDIMLLYRNARVDRGILCFLFSSTEPKTHNLSL